MDIEIFQQNIQSHDKLIHIAVQFEQDLDKKKQHIFLINLFLIKKKFT